MSDDDDEVQPPPMAEVVEALRPPAGGGPLSLGELRDALMPPGTDREALWSALKGAPVTGPAKEELLGKIAQFHQTGGHMPGQPAPDISVRVMPCQACGTYHPPGTPCRAPASLPADPFGGSMTQGAVAATAMHEAFKDLMAGGFTEDQALTFLARAYAAKNGSSDGE